jgi:hypothetical protein
LNNDERGEEGNFFEEEVSLLPTPLLLSRTLKKHLKRSLSMKNSCNA